MKQKLAKSYDVMVNKEAVAVAGVIGHFTGDSGPDRHPRLNPQMSKVVKGRSHRGWCKYPHKFEAFMAGQLLLFSATLHSTLCAVHNGMGFLPG